MNTIQLSAHISKTNFQLVFFLKRNKIHLQFRLLLETPPRKKENIESEIYLD